MNSIEEDELIRPGNVTTEILGFTAERHVFAYSGKIAWITRQPFLGKPRLDFPGGMCCLIHRGGNDIARYWTTFKDRSDPLYVASSSTNEPLLNIQCPSTKVRYRLTGQLSNDSEEDTVLFSLRSDQNVTELLEIRLPARILHVRKPLNLLLVAFSYFLSIDDLYPRIVPFMVPLFH
jgi:hypothetical protein